MQKTSVRKEKNDAVPRNTKRKTVGGRLGFEP